MKVADLFEARYAGDFSVDEVLRHYRDVAQEYEYKITNPFPDDPIEDADARTVRIGDQTGVALTVIVNNVDGSRNRNTALRLFRSMLENNNLPYTNIRFLETTSEDRYYIEAVYVPRRAVNEARYAGYSPSGELKQLISAGEDGSVRFQIEDFDKVVRDIEKTFGEHLQLMDRTSAEQGQGLRRAVYHYWDKNDERWTISVGAYYPNRRAFVRLTKYVNPYLREAQYATAGMPGELKRRIANGKGEHQRGILPPDRMATIPYQSWLEDNEEHIEELYRNVKSKFEQLDRDGENIQEWLRKNEAAMWPVWYEFTPHLRSYLGEPSSPQMYQSYYRQIENIQRIIYDYLLEKYQ